MSVATLSSPTKAAPAVQPLRVMFINRDLEFHGGVSNVLLTLARGNDPALARFDFGSLMPPSMAIAAAFEKLGIELHCFGDHGYLQPIKALRKVLRHDHVDFVVASSFKAGMVARAAAVGTRTKVVHYVHAIDLVLQGKLKRRFFALVAKRDPMLFVSRAVQTAHRPANHRGPSAVVYNGVRDPYELPEARPYEGSFRKELGVPDDALTLLYVAAFVGWKDHATLLAAFAKLDPGLNAHLVLIGKAEPGSTVEEQVAAQNNPRIHLVGPRPDARQIMGATDIYVHSSRREGFGLAVVEAMLAGRPVIATREGAFVEYIEEGKTGLLADAGDPASFARQIEILAGNADLRDQIGRAGRDAALKRFDPKLIAGEMRSYLAGIPGK